MQSHGINVGGLVTIEVGNIGSAPTNSLTLPITPNQGKAQNLKTTATQTLSGIWIDRFGLGIQSVTLSGNTGWASPFGKFNGQPVDGNTAALHLFRDIIRYYENQQMQNPNSQVMTIYNDVTGEAWDVEPVGSPSDQRVNTDGLTLNYTLQFVVLKDLVSGYVAPASGLSQLGMSVVASSTKIPDPVISSFSSPQTVQKTSAFNVQNASIVATSAKQTPNRVRVIQAGDTIWTISEDYLPKSATNEQIQAFVDAIDALNKLHNPNLIFPGETIQIPS
jgi:hypothetical protein